MPLSQNYEAKEWEARITKKWQKNKVGSPDEQSSRQELGDSSTYSILMPPPNLTGDLHAGHAFQHFLMDTLSRIARQNGMITLWYPGVDHAGIQMEGVINKLFKQEFGKDRDEVSDQEFIEMCWAKANEWRDNQKNQAAILGDTPDYSRELFTLDDRAVKMVNFAFKKYWEDGLIYKGAYLVNWSVGLQTALSDVTGEIEYEDRIDPFITFYYKFKSISYLDEKDMELALKLEKYLKSNPIKVSTVRPETIYGDVAVAIHPERLQDCLQDNSLNKAECKKIINLLNSAKITVILYCDAGKKVEVKLIVSDTVEKDFGSGALKITPANDQTDFDIYNEFVSRGVLEANFVSVVGRDGKMKDTEVVDGLTVEDARIEVIKILINNNFVPTKEASN